MISQLASQHHTSEYNLLKFGANGCPIKYLPISLQLPDLFKQLKLRQLQSSHTKPWWHCTKTHSPVFVLGPAGAQSHQSTLIEERIQAAISAPLSLFQVNPSVKTSSTHPIKYAYHITFNSSLIPFSISPIIPPELIPFISSQLTLSSSQPPTVFNIPPLFALDHLLSSSQRKLPILPRVTVSDFKRHIIPSSTIIPHGTLHSNASSVSLTLSLSISEPSPLAQFQ
jgi:hypothetical protein